MTNTDNYPSDHLAAALTEYLGRTWNQSDGTNIPAYRALLNDLRRRCKAAHGHGFRSRGYVGYYEFHGGEHAGDWIYVTGRFTASTGPLATSVSLSEFSIVHNRLELERFIAEGKIK